MSALPRAGPAHSARSAGRAGASAGARGQGRGAEAGAERSPHVQGRRPAPLGAVGVRRALLGGDERDRRPVWVLGRRGETVRKEVPAPAGADRWLRREGRLRWLRGCRCFRFWCAATGRCRCLPPPLRSAPGPSAPPPPGRPPLPPPSSCSHGGSRGAPPLHRGACSDWRDGAPPGANQKTAPPPARGPRTLDLKSCAYTLARSIAHKRNELRKTRRKEPSYICLNEWFSDLASHQNPLGNFS
ncbi:myb-related transcription factor, partner of profilin-like isoform X2 [Cervus canadensis]|uniref:myb-related transcription factor, partner of profilin-like isoform X2 n=1 Tax=Cervus canadensis TaxID=1574408 RepID=UPI001C9E97E6|nr:myb-related transcription factor, partner of profilin-like isoform X2 [Cervus canadensis]